MLRFFSCLPRLMQPPGLYSQGRTLEEPSVQYPSNPTRMTKDPKTLKEAVFQQMAGLRCPADELTADKPHSHFWSCLVSTLKYRQAPEITRHLRKVSNLKPRHHNNWKNNQVKSRRNRYCVREEISEKLSLTFSRKKRK